MIFFSSKKVGYVIVSKVGHMFFFLKVAVPFVGIFWRFRTLLKHVHLVGGGFKDFVFSPHTLGR